MPRRVNIDNVRVGAIGRDRRVAGVDRRRIDRGRSLVARRRVIAGRVDWRPAIGRRAFGGVVAVIGVVAAIAIINPAAAVIAAPVIAGAATAPTPIAAKIGGPPPAAKASASTVNAAAPVMAVAPPPIQWPPPPNGRRLSPAPRRRREPRPSPRRRDTGSEISHRDAFSCPFALNRTDFDASRENHMASVRPRGKFNPGGSHPAGARIFRTSECPYGCGN